MKASELVLQTWIIFPIVLVVLGVSVISTLILMTQHTLHDVHDAFDDAHGVLLDHVQDRVHLLLQANASVYDVARILSSPLNMNLSSFSSIESKVLSRLFMDFTTLSWVSQISYVETNGLLFSYYHERNQTYAIFSNISNSPNDPATYYCYSQQVNGATGERYGDAITLPPIQPNESQWFHDALNGKSGHASLGVGWGMDRDQMLFFTAPVTNIGVVSLGVAVNFFTNYVFGIDLHGAHLYLSIGDGHFSAQTGPLPDIQCVLRDNVVSVHVVDPNNIMSKEEYLDVSCQIDNSGSLSTKYLDIWGKRYMFDCASFDATGIQLVSVMAFPCKGVIHLFQKTKIIVVSLLSFLILGVIFGSYIALQLFRRSQEQETFLRANLIKQKEAIQQAERKSMNKSLAFASTSHDVRTSLAGITGLIELCRGDVPPQSELDRNLVQMNACASKLLGILNSVLDISKVEAGKMQLEEVEFDLAQVLEESVEFFHVVALKKGLEVMWDPCDFSVLKSLNVKGDCRRLKQILDNLLGNAIKFTSEGHVVVRAWSKKPSFENSKLSSKHGCRFPNVFGPLSRWLYKDGDAHNTLNPVQPDPNLIEFIFEVDDTGMGIPKEKRDSVFENYVQVKESPLGGHEGTGLGLGIVQSFVRLMGGEINIRDKEPGERGTCFRFNIFLKSCEMSSDGVEGEDKNSCNNLMSEQSLALSTREHMATKSNIRAKTFRKALKVEGIHNLLLVEGDERKRILQRWMESLGMKVWTVHHWELLYPMLEKIKCIDSSGKFDPTSQSYSLNRIKSHNSNIEKNGSPKSKDDLDQTLPLTTKDVFRRTCFKDSPVYILVVIDINCEDLSNICSILNDFSKGNKSIQCKIVWLVNKNTHSADLRRLKQAPCDLILQKPFHYSWLCAVLRLMQEFGGRNEGHPFKMGIQNTLQDVQQSSEPSSSMESNKVNSPAPQSVEPAYQRSALGYDMDNDKPLSGMNILLVEDTFFLQHLASAILSRLGATIESSENGLEALNLIKKALQAAAHDYDESTKAQGVSEHFPYDVVLMDCEMPIMNGYEATRNIRTEEKHYGIHIPIIALTAHATPEEEKKTILSGMDFHLTKPINAEKLLEAINYVRQN